MNNSCYLCKKELHTFDFVHESREFNTLPQGMTEDDVLCNDCTKNYQKETGTDQSKLWYLAPIFLGIIGGLLMFVALRKENWKMAKNGLILSIVLQVIGIVVAIGFSSIIMALSNF